MNIVLYRHFESKAFSRSPRLPSTECRIGRLENLKLVSNGNTSNMIPLLNVYGNMNLVLYLVKSSIKSLQTLLDFNTWPTRFISP